jgi:hypothetical protein
MGIGCDIIFTAIIRHFTAYCHWNFPCLFPDAKLAEDEVEQVFRRRLVLAVQVRSRLFWR